MKIYLPESLKKTLEVKNKRGKVTKEAISGFFSNNVQSRLEYMGLEGLMTYRGRWGYDAERICSDNVEIVYVEDHEFFSKVDAMNKLIEMDLEIEKLKKDSIELEKLKNSIQSIKGVISE